MQNKNITLNYQGQQSTYLISTNPARYQNRLKAVKLAFANKIVFNKWLEEGKITSSDAAVDDNGNQIQMLSSNVSKSLQDLYDEEVQVIASQITVQA